MDTVEQSSATSSVGTKLAIVVVGIVLLLVAAYAGFVAGQQLANADALVQLSDLKAQNALLQSRLDVSNEKLQVAIGANAHMQEKLAATPLPSANQDEPISTVPQVSCSYAAQQVQQIEKSLKKPDSAIVYDASPKWQEEQRLKRADLEQQLADYQARLQSCE